MHHVYFRVSEFGLYVITVKKDEKGKRIKTNAKMDEAVSF
jgi:hypothetical protein